METKLITEATKHLSQSDKVLLAVIKQTGLLSSKRNVSFGKSEHFAALAFSMIAQQISEKFAQTIIFRLFDLLKTNKPTPELIIKIKAYELRALGLSWAKVNYLTDLSNKILDGSLDFKKFGKLSDEEIINELTKVKGIGLWTATQFLFWHLERPNVLPIKDTGIKMAVKELYKLNELPTEQQLTDIAESWKPYRAIACKYILKSIEGPDISRAWPIELPARGLGQQRQKLASSNAKKKNSH
jgi:DNA-3-methyladenine glycosylase II